MPAARMQLSTKYRSNTLLLVVDLRSADTVDGIHEHLQDEIAVECAARMRLQAGGIVGPDDFVLAQHRVADDIARRVMRQRSSTLLSRELPTHAGSLRDTWTISVSLRAAVRVLDAIVFPFHDVSVTEQWLIGDCYATRTDFGAAMHARQQMLRDAIRAHTRAGELLIRAVRDAQQLRASDDMLAERLRGVLGRRVATNWLWPSTLRQAEDMLFDDEE